MSKPDPRRLRREQVGLLERQLQRHQHRQQTEDADQHHRRADQRPPGRRSSVAAVSRRCSTSGRGIAISPAYFSASAASAAWAAAFSAACGLVLAEHDRHDRLPERLGDVGVLLDLRPDLLDVVQVLHERRCAGHVLVELVEHGLVLADRGADRQVAGAQRERLDLLGCRQPLDEVDGRLLALVAVVEHHPVVRARRSSGGRRSNRRRWASPARRSRCRRAELRSHGPVISIATLPLFISFGPVLVGGVEVQRLVGDGHLLQHGQRLDARPRS